VRNRPRPPSFAKSLGRALRNRHALDLAPRLRRVDAVPLAAAVPVERHGFSERLRSRIHRRADAALVLVDVVDRKPAAACDLRPLNGPLVLREWFDLRHATESRARDAIILPARLVMRVEADKDSNYVDAFCDRLTNKKRETCRRAWSMNGIQRVLSGPDALMPQP